MNTTIEAATGDSFELNEKGRCLRQKVRQKMTLNDMVEKLRKKEVVEIRDHDNYLICTCQTDSKGIIPYLENEILEWFVFTDSVFYGPNFCVLINDEVEQNK